MTDENVFEGEKINKMHVLDPSLVVGASNSTEIVQYTVTRVEHPRGRIDRH